MKTQDIILTATAKAFSGESARPYSFLISPDAVRVWDRVAGYYTTVHSLSAAAQRRLRGMVA